MPETPEGFPRLDKQTRPHTCPKGDEACERTKPCRSCLGRRNRAMGLRKQRAAAKAFGVPTARYHGQNGNEENWRHYFILESKAGKQVSPIWTRYIEAENQALGNRAVGDLRQPVMLATPPGLPEGEGLVVMRISVWRTHLAPFFESEGA